jgi:lipoprotein NlpD
MVPRGVFSWGHVQTPMRHSIRLVAAAAALTILVGCASSSRRAPVEDRGRSASASASSATVAPTKPPPGAENAGKPGYYTVKPGDTLIRIALESGQQWRDIAAWNGLENPNLIEVGQVVRVEPPAAEAASGVVVKPLGSARIDPRPTPVTAPAEARPVQPPRGANAAVATGSAPSQAAAPTASSSSDVRDADGPNWAWPAAGPVLVSFEEGRNKGLTIGGKAGDPVLAAADGHVVYAGSGLRGYGNLVIVKHGPEFLSAYAHNQTLLVKEDQAVRRGQKIAEMGATDADRVQLHFEIRKKGRPIDPTRQLPSR